ncbi:DUF2607 family protein [Vibrio vulnificus]|nr:DUF2607 family protein [Vibrio vulnificus]
MQHGLTTSMNKLHHTAIFAVVLSLFLSFASIAHDFDFNAEHHNAHHCQLFANAHHGVSLAVMTMVVSPPIWFESTPLTFEAPFAVIAAYLARSPPVDAPR